jgi:hypothetical protein
LRFTREVVRVVVFEVYQRSGACRCVWGLPDKWCVSLCLRFTREVVRVVVFEVYQRSGACRCVWGLPEKWYVSLCLRFTREVVRVVVVHFITFYVWFFSLQSCYYWLLSSVCDKVCQWFTAGWWFSPGTPVSSTN